MTKEQIKKLITSGYTAIIRRYGEQLFTPIKGDDNTISDNANVTPLREDEILFLDDILSWGEEELQHLGEIRTPLKPV